MLEKCITTFFALNDIEDRQSNAGVKNESYEDFACEIMQSELKMGRDAVEEYCLLLCQSGQFDEAIPYLEYLNYSWRLARNVRSLTATQT
jgi:hypothetical protein